MDSKELRESNRRLRAQNTKLRYLRKLYKTLLEGKEEEIKLLGDSYDCAMEALDLAMKRIDELKKPEV